MYCNIQGLTGNVNEAEQCFVNTKYDFIIMSETHITENIEDREIELEGYQIVRCNSESRHTGGLCIYVKDYSEVKIITQEKIIPEHIYWLVIKITSNNQSLYLAAVYRSPNSSVRLFCDKFKAWIEDLVDLERQFIIAGDFNIDWMDMSNIYSKEMKETIEIVNMCQQLVHEPTRSTSTTSTLIDYVITDVMPASAKTDIQLKIGDHETVVIEYEMKQKIEKIHNENKIKILRYNKASFINQLRRSEMIFNICNPQESSKILSDELIKVTNSMVVAKDVSKMSNGWFNNTLMQLKREKIMRYQECRQNDKIESWNRYKECRNIYKAEIVKSKNSYIKQQIANAGDQKSMWRVIKSHVLNEKRQCIKHVYFEGVSITKKEEIAGKFNEYFIRSVSEINESIPYVRFTQQKNFTNTTFKFKYVVMSEIKDAIKSLNNKRDFNFINTKMLMDGINTIGPMLAKVINHSMLSGCFPETWKESIVTPIEKIKGTDKCENFRPINALPVYEKVIEKIVHSQLENHFEFNKLFIENQSGFRKKHSCESALNNVLISWKEEIAKKKGRVCRFSRFQKSF